MVQLKNILVPVDFSIPSKNALAYGLSLAIPFHARLVVAHVVPSMAAFNYTFPNENVDIEKLALDSARRTLKDFVPASFQDRVELRPILRAGDVRTELLGIIDEEKIDLVVMGTYGRRNIERFILGSTTEHILRKVPVPILTVTRIERAQETPDPGTVPIHRIVYASDLTSGTEVGLRYASELAQMFGAKLTVLHAVDPLESGRWGLEVAGALPFDFAAIQEQAMTQMGKAVASVCAPHIHVETIVIEGIPHSAISHFAEASKADLLVLNLQSKGVLERVMLGSTAERVIRSSHIPVLSIPVGTALRYMQVPGGSQKSKEKPEGFEGSGGKEHEWTV